MKVEDLEVGKHYGCLLTKMKVLVISQKDAKDKEIKAGVIGISRVKDNGEVQLGYNVINVYDGQLEELEKQPTLIKESK